MTYRLRYIPKFPANISGANGFTVERDGVDLVVKPDFGNLVQTPSVTDQTNTLFMVWDKLQDFYTTMSFTDVLATVSGSFMLKSVYDPTNIGASPFARANHTGTQAISTVANLQSSLDAKAPLASPALTGTPTAPTAAGGTNSTQVATTAFVQTEVSAVNANLSFAEAQGRLSLSTGVPITVSDVTAAGTLYWTPYLGTRIWLYSGSAWLPFTPGELSISLASTTASRPHDVFMAYNGGTPILVLTAWTSDTARATALTTQNGILVKSGTTTQRYLGTVYVNASNQCEDSNARRWVWNMNNRRPRAMRVVEGTDTWNYTTNTIRQVNGSTANQLDFVRGLDEDAVSARAMAVASNPTVPCTIRTLIGLNSTTAPVSGSLFNLVELQVASRTQTSAAEYSGFPGAGRHFLAWLEQSSATGTTTWYGDNGSTTSVQTGITGLVWS